MNHVIKINEYLEKDISNNSLSEKYNTKVLVIKTRFDFMPLGIGYVLSSLEEANIPFDFWDMLRDNPYDEEKFLQKIKKNEYFLIGTGGFVFNIHDFIEITNKCKKANNAIPIVLGGNITRNLSSEKLLNYLDIDYVYIGEAEASFVQFASSLYSGNTDFTNIAGIAYRDPKSLVVLKSGQTRVDLAKTDLMPAYHLLDVEHYISTNRHIRFHKLGKVMAMLTGRGCTGGCSFCSPTVGKFIAPEITNTIKEIKYLNEKYTFDALNFITEIFFQHPHEVLQFCTAYKELNINKPWFCCVSPHMSSDIYSTMKSAGCVGFNMGLESGSDRILAKTKIGCTVENFEKKFQVARENGLFVDVSYMILNENETEEDVRATFDTLIRNRMQQESFGLVSAYPGTSIYAKAFKQGRVKDELSYIKSVMSGRYWRTYNIAEFDYLNISAIPDEQIFNVVMREVRRYYTYLRNEFKVNHQSIERFIEEKSNLQKIKYKGNCSECNTQLCREIDLSLVEGIFEHTQICHNCFSRSFFDFTEINEYKSFFDDLKQKINMSNKIIIVGRGKIAEDLLFYDVLNLDASKILCVIDERSEEEELRGIEEHSFSEKKFFFNLPRVRKEELVKYDYDLLLIADLLPSMVGFIPESSFAKVAYVNPITDKIASQMQEKIIANKTQNTFMQPIHAVEYKEVARNFAIKILNKNKYIKKIAKMTYNSFSKIN